MTRYALEKAGPLEVIDISVENPGPQTPTVVMLHGYGADAHDLAPLSHVLKMPEGSRWLIPQGPLEVPIGPFYSGRGWAPINMQEWPRDLSEERSPEILESASKVLELLRLKKVNLEKVVFAGFSQGAMLATHLTLTCGVRPLGLVVMSGTLVSATQWRALGKALAPQFSGFNFFQCHGLHDDVLPVDGADKLHKLLKECGWIGDYFKFEGAHEIPPAAVQKIQKYLFELFPRSEWERHAD